MATVVSRRRIPDLLSRRNGAGASETVECTARLGRRTKHLVRRLAPGDVAVIDHVNIDRIAAEELIATGVAVVINASPSSDGRYPNAGPLLLGPGRSRPARRRRRRPFRAARRRRPGNDRRRLVLSGEQEVLRRARRSTSSELSASCDEQRERVDEALADFAENTVAHVRQEADLLTGSVDFPPTRGPIRDRHVADRRPREPPTRPEGAAGLHPRRPPADRRRRRRRRRVLEAGLKPDVILGDMDSARDESLPAAPS